MPLRGADFYGTCAVGGVLSCGLTHAGTVFLDVHKCRSQARPDVWPKGLIQGLSKLRAEGGATTGVAPTFLGYGAQGMFKFGLNEFFQDVYGDLLFGGKDKIDSKAKKMAFQAVSSASAEIFADLALCPFEMTKVKMQVELPADNFAKMGVIQALKEMNAAKLENGFPFRSLVPLWGRQVPYTVIKFVVFYQTAEFIYEQLRVQKQWKREELSKATCLGITFAAGYWAGIFCAVSTQPMDNLVSMMGNPANQGKSLGTMAGEMGIKNLFTKGLGTRILMVGTLTGFQWWIYGSFKSAMGLGTQ